MGTIIIIIIIVLVLALLPYLIYGWLFGLTLIKRLIQSEWKEAKGLLGAYRRLTPEQRMDLEIKRVKTEETEPPKSPNDSAWLGSPTPKEELIAKTEQGLKEGIVEHPQEGKWETPKEAEAKVVDTSQPARVA